MKVGNLNNEVYDPFIVISAVLRGLFNVDQLWSIVKDGFVRVLGMLHVDMHADIYFNLFGI